MKLIGKTFAKKYYLQRLIGEGGFGKVYAATYLDLSIEVAVKIVIHNLI